MGQIINIDPRQICTKIVQTIQGRLLVPLTAINESNITSDNLWIK